MKAPGAQDGDWAHVYVSGAGVVGVRTCVRILCEPGGQDKAIDTSTMSVPHLEVQIHTWTALVKCKIDTSISNQSKYNYFILS